MLPANPRAIAISHRGHYNDYYEDGSGAKHRCGTGVTTLYCAESNGKIIRKYDPWSPRFAKMNIYVPETSTTSFELLNMDASASHLMLLGYETAKNPEGRGTIQRLTIKTKLADLDSEGWNPGLKYDYFPHPTDRKVRVIPNKPWRSHSFDFKAGERITKKISIIQTGEGNDAREIRIEGWNAEGMKGYFHKMVDEQDWQFKPFAAITVEQPLDLEIRNEKGRLRTSVFNFNSRRVDFRALKRMSSLKSLLKNLASEILIPI